MTRHRRVSRRPGKFPGRRRALTGRALPGVICLAAALSALLAVTATAAADNATQQVVATVYPPGASTFTESTTVGQLEGGGGSAPCPTYTGPNVEQYDGPNSPSEQITSQAWTITSLLACLPNQIPLTSVNRVVILNTAGQPEAGANSILSASDLQSPPNSDWYDPQQAPIIYSDSEQLFYDRPQRSEYDKNLPDQVIDDGQPFQFQVFETPALTVTITPSRTEAAVGQKVSFRAHVTGASGTLSYSWFFGGFANGAQTSSAAATSTSFSQGGNQRVTLTVTDKEADEVGYASVAVAVPTSTTPTTTTPTMSTPTTSTPATTGSHPGGTKGGGGGVSRGGGKGTGASGTGGGSGSGSGSGSNNPGTSVTGARGAGHRDAGTGPGHTAGAGSAASSGTSNSGLARLAKSAQRSSSAKTPPAQPSAPLRPGVRRVDGQLIGTINPVIAASSPLARLLKSSSQSPDHAAEQADSPPLGSIGGGLGVLLLLAFGAGWELRGRRPGAVMLSD